MGGKARRSVVAVLGVVVLGLVSFGCGEDPGAAGNGGDATALLLVNNHSEVDAELFVDSLPVGTIPAGVSQGFDGDYAGLHDLLARSTDGRFSWGPVTVEIDKNGSHTWNLLGAE